MNWASTRYHRQELLPGFGSEGQKRLSEARILVIGAGGLGCPALQYLAAAGVGHLGMADPDVVSISNLHRQVLYSEQDIGQPKVEVAKRRLLQLNSSIEVRTWQAVFDPTHCLQFINDYDVVLDATDRFASRYWISDACFLIKKPLVFGAVSRFEGQVAVFKELSYRDLFPIQPMEGTVQDCASAGVLGVLPGMIGVLQATEVLKIITGIGVPLYDQLLHYQSLSQSFYTIKLQANPVAAAHRPTNLEAYQTMEYEAICDSTVPLVSVEVWREAPQDYCLIDVREMDEQPRLDGLLAQVFPKSRWAEGWENESEKKLLFVCQSGIRSNQVAALVRQKNPGLRVFSLEGGVQAMIKHNLL